MYEARSAEDIRMYESTVIEFFLRLKIRQIGTNPMAEGGPVFTFRSPKLLNKQYVLHQLPYLDDQNVQ